MRNITCIALCAIALPLFAQTGNRRVTQNDQSPPADTSMTLGGKKVTIEYNAPSARGRKVEGGLIPYGSIWRFGADSATTMTTEGDIMVGDLKVPAGAHTLYILASENGWKLVVNNQIKQWGLTYSQAQDLGRTDMKLTKLSAPVEKMTITLKPAGANRGEIELQWGATKATVPIKPA